LLLKLKSIVSQLRVRQWVKNAIVLAPLLFSGEGNSWILIWNGFVCAIAFCLISSALYILNDIFDLSVDRLHPSKKQRPLAAGKLSLLSVSILAVVCLSLSIVLAFSIRPTLILVFLLYLLINVCYSLYLKHIALIDIFCVASGFVLRAVAGALAIHVILSGWFLLCTTFGAMFIALEKRRQELGLLKDKQLPSRRGLELYSPRLIQRIESILVASAVTGYAFYSFQSPHGQWMMITVPLVLYGVMRYQLLSEHSKLTSTPEEIFWKDRSIQITLILWFLTCGFVIYGHPGLLVHKVSTVLDSLTSK
jgi:4-hydroxybenzoate polyprenyltransferase